MRREHLVLGAAGVLALLLAACGSSSPTAANNTTSTSAAPTTSSTGSTSTSGAGAAATSSSTTTGGSTGTTSAPTTTAKATTTTAKATTTTAKATTTTGGAATNVTATEVEYKITLSTNSFHPGAYVFKVVNNGTVSHGFVITGPGVNKSDQIQPPGGSETVSVTLQAGSYEIYCPVDSHKALGMDDHITVS